MIKTALTASVYPKVHKFGPSRYPIVAVPQSYDFYRLPFVIPGTAEYLAWSEWRDEASHSVEQKFVLLAMAQYQAETLDLLHGLKDHTQHFEVLCPPIVN